MAAVVTVVAAAVVADLPPVAVAAGLSQVWLIQVLELTRGLLLGYQHHSARDLVLRNQVIAVVVTVVAAGAGHSHPTEAAVVVAAKVTLEHRGLMHEG